MMTMEEFSDKDINNKDIFRIKSLSVAKELVMDDLNEILDKLTYLRNCGRRTLSTWEQQRLDLAKECLETVCIDDNIKLENLRRVSGSINIITGYGNVIKQKYEDYVSKLDNSTYYYKKLLEKVYDDYVEISSGARLSVDLLEVSAEVNKLVRKSESERTSKELVNSINYVLEAKIKVEEYLKSSRGE